MESRIPLPTDNIYKFYALFGLLLFVTAVAAFLYVHKTTNALAFEATVKIEELQSKDKPSPTETKRKEMLERELDIAASDKAFFMNVIVGLAVIAIWSMLYGFAKWHLVLQPRQDELLDLQIQKAKQDLQKPQWKPFRRPGQNA